MSNEIKDLKEVMLKQFELLNKRIDSHENLTVQLINMIRTLKDNTEDMKEEVRNLRQDVEFIYKDSAITKLEVERLKRSQDHL